MFATAHNPGHKWEQATSLTAGENQLLACVCWLQGGELLNRSFQVNLRRGGVSTPLTWELCYVSTFLTTPYQLIRRVSSWLWANPSSCFLYRLPVGHIFLKGDEMCLSADFYCAKLHIFTTKSYKSEAVATYNHRLPFISYYILDCLTSNIFDIKCKLFMDIRLTQTNIATN